jgi:hypothetical protein
MSNTTKGLEHDSQNQLRAPMPEGRECNPITGIQTANVYMK